MIMRVMEPIICFTQTIMYVTQMIMRVTEPIMRVMQQSFASRKLTFPEIAISLRECVGDQNFDAFSLRV